MAMDKVKTAQKNKADELIEKQHEKELSNSTDITIQELTNEAQNKEASFVNHTSLKKKRGDQRKEIKKKQVSYTVSPENLERYKNAISKSKPMPKNLSQLIDWALDEYIENHNLE